IYTIFSCVSTPSGTAKFFGFRIKGNPLESAATENLDCSPCSRCHGAHLAIHFSPGDHPVSRQSILFVRYSLPNFYSLFPLSLRNGDSVALPIEVEVLGLAYLVWIERVEIVSFCVLIPIK